MSGRVMAGSDMLRYDRSKGHWDGRQDRKGRVSTDQNRWDGLGGVSTGWDGLVWIRTGWDGLDVGGLKSCWDWLGHFFHSFEKEDQKFFSGKYPLDIFSTVNYYFLLSTFYRKEMLRKHAVG